MDLRDYLDVLRTRWKLVVACTLLGVIAAGAASLLTTPMYTSTTKVFVTAASPAASDGSSQSGDVSNAYLGSLYTQQIVKSLVDVVTSQPVTQGVVEDLNLDKTPGQVAAQVSASNPLDTSIIEISATDPSPEQAQQIADATAQRFQAAAAEYTQPNGASNSLVTVTQTEPADLPTSPSSPRTRLNLALGFLVGLAVGIGAAVLLETLDTRIKTVDGLQKHFEAPLLAVIANDPEAAKKPLVTQLPPHSTRAESFRALRTNLQFVDIDNRPRSIVVASSIASEGKSTTAINLAITVAQSGQPVILVEGDLRRPKVAEYLGVEGAAGLTDVLIGRATVEDVLQPWGTTGTLWVLPSGALPPNPAELVGSQAMADLISDLEKRAFVIIDVPPLLPVTDGAVLARLSGGALLVAAAGKVRREQLRTAEESIVNVGGRILGLVFTKARQKGPDAHRYAYGYSYDKRSAQPTAPLEGQTTVVPATLVRATAGEPVIGVRSPEPPRPPVNGTASGSVASVPQGSGPTPTMSGDSTAPAKATATGPATGPLERPPAESEPSRRVPDLQPTAAGATPPSSSQATRSATPAAPAPVASLDDAATAQPDAPTPVTATAGEPPANGSGSTGPAAAVAAATAGTRTAQPELRVLRTELPDSPADLGTAAASTATVQPPTAPPSTPAVTSAPAPTTVPAPVSATTLATAAPPVAPAPPDPPRALQPAPVQAVPTTAPAEGDDQSSALERLLGVYHASPVAPATDEVEADDVPVDWTPPAPRAAFDPLTAPLDELARWDAEQRQG